MECMESVLIFVKIFILNYLSNVNNNYRDNVNLLGPTC